MPAEILLALAAVGIAYALVRWRPDWTRRQFDRIRKSRQIVLGLFGLALALVFIFSGSPTLMLVGFLLLVYGALWVMFEDPGETIRDTVSGFR